MTNTTFQNSVEEQIEVDHIEEVEEKAEYEKYEPKSSWLNRHSHRLGPLLVLLLGLAFLFAALPLQFGSISRPGPGFWPLVIAGITVALAVISGFFPRKDEEKFTRTGNIRVAVLLIALLAYPGLFGFFGFIIPTILLIIFMMRVLSGERWMRSIAVAVATTGITYVVFALLLSIRLPAFSFVF